MVSSGPLPTVSGGRWSVPHLQLTQLKLGDGLFFLALHLVSVFCSPIKQNLATHLVDLLLNVPKAVAVNLYTHTQPFRSFPSFCRTPFLPIITESKMGY